MSVLRSLAPGLLLAAPRLGDPNFERTVVLLARHDETGALGWVINGRSAGAVGDLLENSRLLPEGVSPPRNAAFSRVARVGGPVSPESGWVLYPRGETALPGEMDVGETLAVTGDLEALRQVILDGRDNFRLFVGYAGWSPGQLEGEVRAGVWLPADVDASLVLTDADDLWELAYRRTIGAAPGAFVSTRGGSA
ncbi:MAG: YqgE/AlgH family protein [Polyangiales bacterium]